MHYIEEYSRRGNDNSTFDVWVYTNDPRSILKMAWFGLPNPDMEPIPRDMPLPEFNPMHNPPPVGPKAGWTYPVIVHLDIPQGTRMILMTRRMIIGPGTAQGRSPCGRDCSQAVRATGSHEVNRASSRRLEGDGTGKG